jgi:hypothetical protein
LVYLRLLKIRLTRYDLTIDSRLGCGFSACRCDYSMWRRKLGLENSQRRRCAKRQDKLLIRGTLADSHIRLVALTEQLKEALKNIEVTKFAAMSNLK